MMENERMLLTALDTPINSQPDDFKRDVYYNNEIFNAMKWGKE